MTLPYFPILIVDLLGSMGLVLFAAMSLYSAKKLHTKAPDNVIFLYLTWLCSGLTIFALSRAFGHIFRQFSILTGQTEVWQAISAYSGTINTVSFMIVGSITLFFNQNWKINMKMLSKEEALKEIHVKLINLNQTLENKVVERTEMLTASEHKFSRIFKQSLDTILLTDSQWKILDINPAGEKLTGYKKDEMISNEYSMDQLFASNEEWQRIADLIQTHEYILNEETYFMRSDNTNLYVIITGGIDYGPFGCQKHFHFIIKNINEKKEMEQQIIQADKLAALGELSAGVAHEINNPLGVILGYTQFMLKDKVIRKNDHILDDLKVIEKQVKNCQSVVSDMLAFSRKASSSLSARGQTELSRIDMGKVLENVVNFLCNHSDFRNVNMTLTLSDDSPLFVMGNELEFRQVIINLVINACHAVDKKGNIMIFGQINSKGKVVVEVKDDGRGISREHLARIFDPFFTTKPVGEGTGLGLSVSYGIVKKYNGHIDVKSEENQGAHFTLTLPLAT
ncbi:ATP-binding protein [uncultured Desulfobacter sp.]|uniref:two-component system sensor histidine kinase NtrB n=1 Tax=uncultured Desulfobacter sp. TaxID=240139 RepID=UPI002AAB6CB6|nr:ATP-binding protein [uncultured Desulfobacter sp.]